MAIQNVNSVWYREPMVYLLIALPLLAVMYSVATLVLAIKTDDGLVEDDYYARGMAINRVLDRERAAVKHGLESSVVLDETHRELLVRLKARDAMKLPDSIEFKFLHATRAGFDKVLVLPRQADGSYRAPLPELAKGRWNLLVAAQDWRLVGSLFVPNDTTARILATP